MTDAEYAYLGFPSYASTDSRFLRRERGYLAGLQGLGMTNTGQTVCDITEGAFNTAGAAAPLFQDSGASQGELSKTGGKGGANQANNAADWGRLFDAIGGFVGGACDAAGRPVAPGTVPSGEPMYQEPPPPAPAQQDNTKLLVGAGVIVLVAVLLLK